VYNHDLPSFRGRLLLQRIKQPSKSQVAPM
jgi:hypothetical protein